LATRVGNETASSAPTKPPIELPITTGQSMPSRSHNASVTAAKRGIDRSQSGIADSPKPGRSNATQRCDPMKAGIVISQFCQTPPSPWTNSSGGPSPPVSTTCSSVPSTSTRLDSAGQSTSIQDRSSPAA
jgi:hypothetical protein